MKIILLIIIISTTTLSAQFVEDGLRYALSNDRYTARSQALGISYLGISDDVAALHYNPAGLSLMPKMEISFGMNLDLLDNSMAYNSNLFSQQDSKLTLNNVGITFPIEDFMDNSGIGFSFFKSNSYDALSSFNSFRNNNTFISNQANYADKSSNDFRNISYDLYLTDDDYNTPLNNLNQEINILEGGGINNLIFGYGTELSEIFSLGFSINASFGSYKFSKKIIETDTEKKYQNDDLPNDINFYDFYMNEIVNQDVSGFAIKIGFLFKPTENSRLNITVQSPTWIDIDENWSIDANARNDRGNLINNAILSDNGFSAYRVSTPIVMSMGYSININNLTLTSGLEYADMSSISFDTQFNEYSSDDSSPISNSSLISTLNQDAKTLLGNEIKWGLGAEYYLESAKMFMRASASGKSSPWVETQVQGNILNYGGGLGIIVGGSVRIDLTLTVANYNRNEILYGFDENAAKFSNQVSNMNFGMGITYRFD